MCFTTQVRFLLPFFLFSFFLFLHPPPRLNQGNKKQRIKIKKKCRGRKHKSFSNLLKYGAFLGSWKRPFSPPSSSTTRILRQNACFSTYTRSSGEKKKITPKASWYKPKIQFMDQHFWNKFKTTKKRGKWGPSGE